MKIRLLIGSYILGITLLVALMILPVTVRANELPDDDKISVNISVTVPQDFNAELRIRYYDTIGSLPDHIFIMSSRSNYNINIRMLQGKFAYKSTEIDGVSMDEDTYQIDMPDITVINDIRSNKEFKGELIKIKEKPTVISIAPIKDTANMIEQDIKPVEENKYFGTMTEKEIFEWYQEQMEIIIEEDNGDPPLSMLTSVKLETWSLLNFCSSYNMKNKIKNSDDLMKAINTTAGIRDKDSDYYKTIAKIYIYVYEEWQKGNQVDFVFEEEESNEINDEYTALADELTAYDNIENHDISKNASSEAIISDGSGGLVYDDIENSLNENKPDNISTESDTVIKNDEKEDSPNNNKFIAFLKRGGFSFIVVLLVGAVWFIIKRRKE